MKAILLLIILSSSILASAQNDFTAPNKMRDSLKLYKQAQYQANYGSTFNVRSLVDKGYVDSSRNKARDSVVASTVKNLSSQYADASNTSTTETDLLSYTLPANTLLNNGDRIVIEAIFTTPSNSNSKTLRFYFGGYSQTWSSSTIASGVTIKVRITIVKTAATAQRIIQEFFTSFTTLPGYSASTADETTTNVIKFTGQSATASSDITQRTMSVTYYPK